MPKVWGGDRLSRLGKSVAAGATIGESWEVADLGTTSASGAGGAAQRSKIMNGALAGKTLADAVRLWGNALLGTTKLTPEGGFPLLVKFLDAKENLSVQVHPSPEYAATHAGRGAKLKTECWYILDAEPGSVIYKGVKPGITRDAFAKGIADGRVVAMLEAVPAVVGEVHNLPSGTCHALGAGVLVAEIQTPSDTTFRVYDWGRTGRDLHVAESLECIDFRPAPPPLKLKSGGNGAGPALVTEFFRVRHVSLGAGSDFELGAAGSGVPGWIAVMVLSTSGAAEEGPSLYGSDGGFSPLALKAGMTVLVPAAAAEEAVLAAGETGRVEALVVGG